MAMRFPKFFYSKTARDQLAHGTCCRRGVRIVTLFSVLFLIFGSARSGFAGETIPIETVDGMVWVKVDSGKEKLQFLLDSGAGTTVLDLGAARRLGLWLGKRSLVQGVGYRSTAFSISNFNAAVGGIPLSKEVIAFNLHRVNRACSRRVDGLLGIDFFRGRTVQIDYQRKQIHLLSAAELSKVAGESLPLAVRSDCLCIPVKVSSEPTAWMRVDSGCRSAMEWVVNPMKVRRLGLPIGVNTGTGKSVLVDVRLGCCALKNVRAGLHSREIFPNEAGLVGNGLLSNFTVTFDLRRQRLILGR